MMIARALLLALVCAVSSALADPPAQLSIPNGRSPGGDYYEVVFLPGTSENDSTEFQMGIRNLHTDKLIYTEPAGGYVSFNAAASEVNCKCLWSPDGKFVAVYRREQKRGGSVYLYAVAADKVQPVKYPDLDKLLIPRIGPQGRSFYSRPELWGPDHELVLSVSGLRLSEPESFRFLVTLQISRPKNGVPRAKLKSVREDHAIEWWH